MNLKKMLENEHTLKPIRSSFNFLKQKERKVKKYILN